MIYLVHILQVNGKYNSIAWLIKNGVNTDANMLGEYKINSITFSNLKCHLSSQEFVMM